MWTLVVVKLNPVADHAAGVLQSLETMPVRALFLQSSDYPFHHAILLRTVRRDELLLKAIATHQGREAAAGEDQAVVTAQQERRRHTAQRAKAGNQSVFQRA